MAEVFGIVSAVAGAADVLTSAKLFKSLFQDVSEIKGVQRISSETEILHAMTVESASMLDSLASAPPRSAQVALRQCENNAMHLKSLIVRHMDIGPAGSSTLKRMKRAAGTTHAINQIEDALDAFRVSASLLRQIAAE